MSSAILYVAIVAIWACVLIPRWLRRDSSASVPVSSPAEAEGDDEVTSEADVEPEPTGRRRDEAAEERSDLGEERSDPGESRDVPLDPGHRRMVSARRRLLLLLLVLTSVSGVLAGIRLAAWWVIVPPSVMLVCYLPLLRAAARADAERRERIDARARVQVQVRAAHAAAAAPAARPAARPAISPAARAEVLTLSGSSAFDGQDDEEIYDQYADAKLRAVGD